MPARTQGYSWQLVYSTAVHGSSLKTLYRKMAGLDSPVLLVIKDMHKKVPVFLLSLRLSFFPVLINKCHQPLTDLRSLNFQVFGAFSSDPFRVSKSCYGTGETFLFSFNPDFKVKLECIFVTIFYLPLYKSDEEEPENNAMIVTYLVYPQVYKWSGKNTYFVSGDLESLQIGGGG